jgi:hypothetical protein
MENNKTLALEFATNMFGAIKPEIKKRLERVINKPNQKNWDDAHTIIINGSKGMTTLWQAVLKVDPQVPIRKKLDAPWDYIPSSQTIIQAIKNATLSPEKTQLN